MMGNFLPLLAETATHTTFEWGRIQSNADWILPIAAAVVLMLFVRAMYRRDAEELPTWVGWLLTILRTAAFLALLVLYLQPQWRTEREEIHNSRVVLLVDTSLSMGLSDADASAGSAAITRAQQVAQAFGQTDVLEQLRRVHDVVVLRFDEQAGRVASLEKLSPGTPPASEKSENPDGTAATATSESFDWPQLLTPGGTETRLGQSLRQLIFDERNAPVSGIVVFSDGGQNAGPSPEVAIDLAREAKIPIYTVGLGSRHQPGNVRVYELECPERAHPGDPYTITALIQAQALAGQTVTVDVLQREADRGKAATGTGTPAGSQQITLGADGEVVPVKFQLTPTKVGRQTLCVRVQAPAGDHNPNDNFREADVEVVDRKNHVLLIAGGPSREYQYLRTLLFRDKSILVDVLLQSSTAGASQEANAILSEFPSTREQMFAYDCVVALDPNWKTLTQGQVDLLEQWVAEQGGGLVTVAGSVYTGEALNGWVQDSGPAMSKIKALYPIEFQRRFSVVEGETYASQEPWPLEFTREGQEAEFLWLEDNASDNQRAWQQFPGVYSYYPVRGPKPGAIVYARFSDPRAAQGGERPVYMAGQFYGSGRVFYLGSGELWRLRQQDPSYFDRFYTKLIRQVTQGRLLRQSSRGMLTVDRDRYILGNTVKIRAQLTNSKLEPLQASEVALQVFQPDERLQTLSLAADPSRPGLFGGQLTVLQEGSYRLELQIPESSERLSRRLQVKLPDLERENPQLNDKLLQHIADGTQGKYYEGISAALASPDHGGLLGQLKDRTKTIIRTAASDPRWEERWLEWMMLAMAGLLFVEWIVRRICRLA